MQTANTLLDIFEWVTGEPDAVKAARPVRGGRLEKVHRRRNHAEKQKACEGTSLTAYPTVNVVLVVLALVFAVKEWKLTPSKIKDKVLGAMSGLGRIGGGKTVTSEMPDAKARHGQGVRLNGTLVGVVVRGEGGSVKVINLEDASPACPEEPKQEQRSQQNHPQQNHNNNQTGRDEQRRDPRQQTRRDDRRN